MERTIIRSVLIKVIAIALPIILFIGAVEILLRFLGPEYYRFNNLSQEYYTNPRGYHIPVRHEGKNILYGLHYRISKEGYRLPDHEFTEANAKDPGSPGILVIGDSFTVGKGVKYEDLYTTRLSKMLKQNGYRYSVKNCGKAGAAIDSIARIYLYETSQKTYPVVVYGFVLDDFGISVNISGNDFIDINNGGKHWSTIRDISKIANLVIFYIEKIRLSRETTKAYLEAFRSEEAQIGFKIIADINRKEKLSGGKLVIMLFPLLYDFDNYPFREIHERIAFMCAKEKIPMLDLLPVYSFYKDKDLWSNPTDHHPNEIAHKLAAERLYDFLVEQKLVTR
jgi:hypothetical protein